MSSQRAVLWLTAFDSPLPAAWIDIAVQSFSPSEVQRLARIRRLLRREQFVVGHVLLRRLLASLGVVEPSIEFAPDGRPRLARRDDSVNWHVSLSHSRSAVAALAAPAAAGVDIEFQRPLRDPEAVAALLGHAGAFAATVPAGSDPGASVLKLWVATEARAKAQSAERAPGDRDAAWLAEWNSCWVCVAGTANAPQTVVTDVMRETYNSAPRDWIAAP